MVLALFVIGLCFILATVLMSAYESRTMAVARRQTEDADHRPYSARRGPRSE